MIQRNSPRPPAERDNRPKWFNSPITFHEGTLANIRQHIPAFERRVFALTQADHQVTRFNERLDTIVRLPFGQDNAFIPVGVVSKDYALVPHTSVLDVATQALADVNIAPADVKAELKITEYGERMALSLYLPERYQFDPGDSHPMALRLECFNSVDGSTRFRALMGWFRFVCSNGLIIGVTRSDLRRRHVGDLQIEDIGKVLKSGLNDSDTEKKNFEKWRKTPINLKQIVSWSENTVRKGWGFKAATRVYHIAHTGVDVEVTGQYKDSTPTMITTNSLHPVPGVPKQSQNLFDVSQILAWLAKERRDLKEQQEWRETIPELLEPLMS